MTSPRPSPGPRPGPRDEAPRPAPTRPVDAPRSAARRSLAERLDGWRPTALASRGAQVRASREPADTGRRRRSRLEPPLDPTSWTGALITMTSLAAVLWVVQIVNALDDYGLNRFGLRPRSIGGLWGIVTQPFLHASYGHLGSNTLPFVLIGWVVLLSGLRVWALVSATVIVVGGALTWVVGPGHTVIVGASGLIFGWLGYLLARAYFSRSLKWIFSAVAVLIFFGTLLVELFPMVHSHVSWQSHVCGFAAGVGVAALLHPRGRARRQFRRTAVS